MGSLGEQVQDDVMHDNAWQLVTRGTVAPMSQRRHRGRMSAVGERGTNSGTTDGRHAAAPPSSIANQVTDLPGMTQSIH
jgi:hypothetical protein